MVDRSVELRCTVHYPSVELEELRVRLDDDLLDAGARSEVRAAMDRERVPVLRPKRDDLAMVVTEDDLRAVVSEVQLLVDVRDEVELFV